MKTLAADAIMARATPLAHQQAPDMQPYAHEIVIETRAMARRAAEAGDDVTKDLLVSDVIRRSELQVWFVAEHASTRRSLARSDSSLEGARE